LTLFDLLLGTHIGEIRARLVRLHAFRAESEEQTDEREEE
jgi:hypothetical protein